VDDPTGETYFSLLCLAGIFMLTIYVLPCVMRPLDFITNFTKYTVGFVAYMVMMPVFTNVFQIYAMCNLHDVSWGNRPASTGQEAFTDVKKDQKKAEDDYKLYRTNFVLIWLAANMGYYIMIVELVNTSGDNQVGDVVDADHGYLTIFSCYLACLVIFRVTFAVIYICKWKFRYNFVAKYKVQERNLTQEVKKLKKHSSNGESTDDEEIEEELNKYYDQNKDDISRKLDESMVRGSHCASDVRDATLTHLRRATVGVYVEENDNDPDYDFKEYGDAEIEEAEDRIYSEYKRLQGKGALMDEETMQKLAGGVMLSDMDQSIIVSAHAGHFTVGSNNKLKKDASLLDLSALVNMPDRR
jgi:hypothetical protein